MPNINWRHFSQRQLSFLAHIKTDRVTIMIRDRQTDKSRLIITILCFYKKIIAAIIIILLNMKNIKRMLYYNL